jgi:hypothetical protein
MSGRLWLERFRHELVRRKLPRQEVARLVEELSDHFIDLTEETMSTDAQVLARMGDPIQIAEAAVGEFRRRQFGRSRWARFATFVLLPVPLLFVVWAGILTATVLVFSGIDALAGAPEEGPHEITPLLVAGSHALILGFVVGPPTLVALFFARLARRTTRRWLWGLSACLLVALVTAAATSSQTFSEEPGKSTLTLGLGIGAFHLAQLGQFLVPFSAGVLSLRRSSVS